ncbi:unnamed protein product [Didymodactylos carnosus]|uniref:Exocyst complex component 2 n=1 Tax=Didymodactylos carnosus TaxID=1234261 RepID=A0A8S2I311_9BILA|nr:unnamed protein product [Didymodactylos carnosus]CAF3710578.1 unnamed protein product [Didymodactylos carnosus]
MPQPLVTGISPREGCPGIKITIRGDHFGNDEKDFIGLKICGDDCRSSAIWINSKKITAYTGSGQGKGDVIVTTRSGGVGSCNVGFYGRVEQAGPLQEVAVWIQEDAVNLFGLNASKAPAILPGSGDSTGAAADNVNVTPAEELYDMFPNSSTDITQSNFNPYYYLLAHKSNATFDELRKNLEHLKVKQSHNEGASTTLVKNNIASFMEAVDIMKDIRRLCAEDRKKNVLEPVIKLTEEIANIAHSMYDTDLERKDYSDTIRNALNVIQRYKFIFHLPQSIERSVKREEYEKVINDLIRARAAFETVGSKVFKNIQREVDQQVQNLRTLFRQRLTEFPSSLEDQKLFIRYLYSLDPRGDPAWDCINNEKNSLVDVLKSCVMDSKHLQQQPNDMKYYHDATALVDQACDVLTTAFPDFWNLTQLYLKKKLYPAERSDENDRAYPHKSPEFLVLTKDIIQTFINVVRLNLLSKLNRDIDSGHEGDEQYLNSEEIMTREAYQRVKTLPHCVQNCRLCVLHLISLEIQADFKKELQQLMFDLRLECFGVLMDHACIEVARLYSQETWDLERDEQLGSHNLNFNTVNLAKGERRFFEDKEGTKQAAIAVYRLLGDFGTVFQTLVKECSTAINTSSTQNGFIDGVSNVGGSSDTGNTSAPLDSSLTKTLKLVIILNNFSYTRKYILPRLKTSFVNYGFRGMDKVFNETDVIYDKIDEQIIDTIQTEYIKPFLNKLETRMYAGRFDWATHSKVIGVKDYVKHIILDLARIHAEVYSISGLLVYNVLSKILNILVNELSKLYKCISQFSKHGGMQACLDIIALQECLGKCMETTTSTKLKEIITFIPDATEYIKSKTLSDMLNAFLKQMQAYLLAFRDVQNTSSQ